MATERWSGTRRAPQRRSAATHRDRAGLLKNAPILLLDEPTSALDPRHRIGHRETIKDLMRDRTTIIIIIIVSPLFTASSIKSLRSKVVRVVEQGRGPELIVGRGGVMQNSTLPGNLRAMSNVDADRRVES